MNVKRHSKPRATGKQKWQLSPGDTTFSAVDRPTRDKQSEQEMPFNEGSEQQDLAVELLVWVNLTVTLACELIALAPLVRDVLENLDPQKVEADRVHLALPEHLMVWANGQLLCQVLRNLLSNAFKYSPKPATVIIHTTQIDAGVRGPGSAQEVCLCVQDAGPGIPPEELPLLFQKFVRLQRDLSGTVQGSGLGLYISKQFVEAMQGRIWVESAGIAGLGSRFFVTLPCHSQAQDEGYGSEHIL